MKYLHYLLVALLAAIVLGGGCSSGIVHPLVSQDSAVSRDKALIVMGVSFQEMYNDTQEDDEIKKIVSADLLKDKKNLTDKLVKKKGTALNEPLHYLAKFRFQFRAAGDEKHEFVRFSLDTREYDVVAIHEFAAGTMRLERIMTDQYRFKAAPISGGDDEFYHRFWVGYEEPYGSWDLEQGKITYMGHLTMYFKTKRYVRGLITPRELVDNIKLVSIVIEDRFEEVKKQLQEEKPWFPASEMENRSRPAKWVYDEAGFEAFNQAPTTDLEKAGKREIKRDVKKYFF